MKTKIFTLFFTLVAGVGTAFAFNIYSVQIGELYYNLDSYDKWGEVTSPNSNSPYWSTDITTANIPAKVQYKGITYDVKWIGSSAFRDCANLTSVTIPNSITVIDRYAFRGCSGLTSIEIPNSVTKIELGTFYDCTGLTTVTIGNSVTSIGDNAFAGCTELTTVTINSDAIVSKAYSSESSFKNIFGSSVQQYVIGNSVTSIGKYAFSGCEGLTSIEMPNSVTSIGDYAFSGCTSLTSIEIPNSVATIGNGAFNGCTGLTSVTINSNAIVSKTYSSESSFKNIFGSSVQQYVIGNGVKSIGDYAFYYCWGVTNVTIPSSVTSIGDNAFAYCATLPSVTIPNRVISIGERAFYHCSSLTSVEIPSNVTSIEEDAFALCTGLTTVTINSDTIVGKNYSSESNFKNIFGSSVPQYVIGNGVTSIGKYAFSGCEGLTSIEIPNSVTDIGYNAFDKCDVHEIHFNGSMEEWYSKLWSQWQVADGYDLYISGIKTTEVIFPNTMKEISDIFSGCTSLTSIEIPNSVISIGEGAFFNCIGLTSVTIPNSVTSIGNEAFYGCTGLTSVTIPNSVTYIGDYAFRGCTGLTSVTCEALTPPILGIYVFKGIDCSKIPLYVPAESLTAYKTAMQWKEFNPVRPINFTGHVITFVNWDGSTLLALPIEEGTIPEYTGETPTHPSDEEYSYTFSGWSPEIVPATQDAVYTAQFIATSITITCVEAAEAALSVSADEVLYNNGKEYTVAGYVTEIATAWQSKYSTVSFWMADTQNGGRVLKAFRAVCYNESDAPRVGDYVRVTGKLSKYGTIAEFVEGCTFVIVSRGEEKEITNCAEAAEAALSVAADEVLYNNGKEYIVAGYVTAISNAWNSTYNHTSFWMADTPNGGNVLKAYRAVCNSMSDVPYVGDYVRVTGKLSKYGTIPEFVEGCTYVIVREGEREGAEETETTEVKATPTEEGSVILEWPAVDGAATYAITIFKNGETVCTLMFDAEGRLMSIGFAAPTRDGNGRNMPAAEQTTNGWRYTVEGLEAGAEYTYTVTVKNVDESVLFTQSVDFTMPAPQGIDDINAATKSQKIVRDGKVYILRGEKTYTVTGQEVK